MRFLQTKRKGFIHIIEIIIISVVMFLVVFQFVNMPTINTEWSGTKLYTQGIDLLNSLDSIGTDWLNTEEVSTLIDNALSLSGSGNISIQYGVQIVGAIKPNISVGCLCGGDVSSGEFKDMVDATQSFYYNGRLIEINVDQIDMIGELPQFSHEYDVIIIMPDFFESPFHPNYQTNGFSTQINNFLREDKGILVIKDYEDFNVAENVTDRTIFGIGWNSSVSALGPMNFNMNMTDPQSPFYDVFKYFYNFPNSTGSKTLYPYEFPSFISANEHLVPSPYEAPGNNAVCALNDSNELCGLILNRGVVSSHGRTAWLSYPESGSLTDEENSVLIKSVIVWLTGDKYDVVKSVINNPVISKIYRTMGPAGLVGKWEFEEPSGTIAYDSSGNSNHGDIYGALAASGRVGNSLTFDGEDDFVSIGISSSMKSIESGNFTIEGWFNATNISVEKGELPLMSEYVVSDPPGHVIYVTDSGELKSEWQFTGGDCSADTGPIISGNQWYHFAYTFNGRYIKLYLNGNIIPVLEVDCGINVGTLKSSQSGLRIGGM